jgi:hypothetical protein
MGLALGAVLVAGMAAYAVTARARQKRRVGTG